MPYITQDARKIIDENPSAAKTYGEYVYLYAKAFIKVWAKRGFSFKTLFEIKKESFKPFTFDEVLELETILSQNGVPAEDRAISRFMAYDEFYRRVGADYENKKIHDNGDVFSGILDLSAADEILPAEQLELDIKEDKVTVKKGGKK